MQLAILGRQPNLSLAELEALFGAEKIESIGNFAALVDTSEPLPQNRLGGTMKSAKLLTRLDKTDLSEAFKHLQTMVPEHLQYLPDGKLQLGVSVYGEKAQRDWLLRQMLTLKKVVKKAGRSVRIIENKTEALESAQVLYNKLTGSLGWEILLIKNGEDFIVAQTTAVQNIDDYSKRDFDRPKRDAFVGMLPPKLAQIMINLVVGQVVDGKWQMANGNEETDPKDHDLRSKILVLDPFCGTGVVLQEAMIMGYSVIGSDLSEKMVDYTQENLDWLSAKYQLPNTNYQITQADATTHNWGLSKKQDLQYKIYIVCETYLGKPLTSLPQKHELDEIMEESNTIAENFLSNIAPQIKTGTRLCLALPAWSLGNNRYQHLKMLDPVRNEASNGVDRLTDLGYNRLDLKHAAQSDLVYHRENQVVARELTILEKI